ncbi:hypothetical protein QQ045_032289 [Rhodiola kirilowii]
MESPWVHIRPNPFVQQKNEKIGQLPGQSFNLSFSHFSGYVTVEEKLGRKLFYRLIESPDIPSSKPFGSMEVLGAPRSDMERPKKLVHFVSSQTE